MDIKEAVDRVRSKLTDEQRSEVGADLETIKSGYLEKVDEAKAAVAESMERKRKLRSQIEDLENITIERDEWKTKFESHDDTDLVQERDKYKTKWNQYLGTQKEKFKEFYGTAKDTEAWKKVKAEYKIPENGELDIEKMDTDALETNIEKMQYHVNLGLFETTQTKPTPPTNKAFKFEGETIPTLEEYQEIKNKYGVTSSQAIKARELLRHR